MHRLIVALGLALLLWASARPAPVPAGTVATMTAAASCAIDDNPQPSDTDQRWRNARHAIAVVTESVWKSAPVHAGLGATRVARIFELARTVSAPDPPAAPVPLYLRHTPLLI